MEGQISFDSVPGSIRVPGQYIEFNTRNAVQGLPQNPQKVLIVAPMSAASSAPFRGPGQVFSDAEAADVFGKGSLAHLMVRQALKNNPYLDLSVIGMADNSAGVAATATATLGGTAKAGTVSLSVGGQTVAVAAAAGESAETVAGRLKDAVNAAELPVTAAASKAVLTLTARHKGIIGHETALSSDMGGSGLTCRLGPFTGGAYNADIVPALAAVSGAHYHIICSAFTNDANAIALAKHVEQVSNAIEQRGCIGVLGLFGSMPASAAHTAKLNSGRITCAWYKGAAEAGGIIAAGYAAVLAFEEDPARPLNTLEIKGLAVTPDTSWPLFAECNSALYNGLTPLTVVNNRVQIMRAVSTYTKSAANADDPALLDITTIRTLDYVRRAVKERIALRFPRGKLSDLLLPKIRSEILDVLLKLEQAEIVENVEANKARLLVQRSIQDANRLNAVIPADVVNGLHVFAGRVDLIL